MAAYIRSQPSAVCSRRFVLAAVSLFEDKTKSTIIEIIDKLYTRTMSVMKIAAIILSALIIASSPLPLSNSERNNTADQMEDEWRNLSPCDERGEYFNMLRRSVLPLIPSKFRVYLRVRFFLSSTS